MQTMSKCTDIDLMWIGLAPERIYYNFVYFQRGFLGEVILNLNGVQIT